MADFIRLLPESIANQIAAGEVVQRPSSVVKELLENSLDAGATSIKLVFRDGGQTLLQVIDNGKGMTETDARMCWERHATSKIKKADDLFDLTTFGFRGEAMASIAAVAQVEMKTKPAGEALGTHIVIEASEVKKQEVVSMNDGTNITVKNLFYNIPVRRNFLKSVSVETKYIIEEFQRVAISRPDVEMSLFNGKNEVYKLRTSGLQQRIEDILLKSKKGKLLDVEEKTEIVRISGFVGSPELARKTRGNQFMYVNGRFIKEPYFHHAINNAYEDLIESDHHPFYVLFLEIDPSKIDVNVHPTKTEVKFEEGRPIYQIILSVLKKALAQYNVTPEIESTAFIPGFDKVSSPFTDRPVKQPSVKTDSRYNPFIGDSVKKKSETHWEKLFEPFRDEPDRTAIPEPQTEITELTSKSESVEVGYVFQVHTRYLVCMVNRELYIVDQKRAHERVLYEKYTSQLNTAKVSCQQLLFPRTLELQPADFELVSNLMDEINQLGFDISPFGKNTLIINGTPADVPKGEEQEMLEGILENYKLNQQEPNLGKRENLARSLARNAGIKSGTVLAQEQSEQLVNDLFLCSQPNYTPSGKPTFVKLDPGKLAGFFE
ncbi:MAG: DNA mismatch repair endonuclease MutL [Bacteroidia bacterium]|nr:DNA mismatch repair endonuclease MutL [Bacteroidia bacterium]